jgi:hypothetical protein
MRHCGHCTKELLTPSGEPDYSRYFCSPDSCGKADRAERMASKRARTKGDIERKIERAIRAHCKGCKEQCAPGIRASAAGSGALPATVKTAQ